MTSQPSVRATDREREDTVETLRAAYAAGCLDERELAERAGYAYGAATRQELHRLLCDLPRGAGPGRRVSPAPPRRVPRHLLGWEFGVMLAGGGAWLIVAALHGVVAVPFILIWLVVLRAWGWLPRLTRGARNSGSDKI